MKDNQLPACGAKREAFVVCGTSLTLVEWRNKRSGKEFTVGVILKMVLSSFLWVAKSPVLVIHQGLLYHTSQSPIYSQYICFTTSFYVTSGFFILTELSSKVTSCGCWLRWRKKSLSRMQGERNKLYNVVLYTQCVHIAFYSELIGVVLAIYEAGKLHVVLNTFKTVKVSKKMITILCVPLSCHFFPDLLDIWHTAPLVVFTKLHKTPCRRVLRV